MVLRFIVTHYRCTPARSRVSESARPPPDHRLHAAEEVVFLRATPQPKRFRAARQSDLVGHPRQRVLSEGSPANRRKASAICTRPLTPVITTSTMVKDEWKWPRALSCSTGTPAAARASA